MMLMLRLRAALASVSCLMLVVPAVETTDLPFRSSIALILPAFLLTYRLAVRGGVLVEASCFWRSSVVVVGDLVRAFDIVGGRTAFEIDGAVGKQRDAGRRRPRVELDLELVELD